LKNDRADCVLDQAALAPRFFPAFENVPFCEGVVHRPDETLLCFLMIRGQEKCEEIEVCRIPSEDLTEIGTSCIVVTKLSDVWL
jgi:hypothetical protein